MYSLKVYFDTLKPNSRTDLLQAQHSICYVHKGAAAINGFDVATDQALYCQDYVKEVAGPEGAVIWRFELERTQSAPTIFFGDGVDSILKMARRVAMFTMMPTSKWLFRLDCIYNGSGIVSAHCHPGSGIRVLLNGHMEITSTIGEWSVNDGTGAVWYEEGSHPVRSTYGEGFSAFLRGMVMPLEFANCTTESPTWIEGPPVNSTGEWKCYSQQIVTLR